MSRYILLCDDGTTRRTDVLTKRHLRQAKRETIIFDAEKGLELSPDTNGKWIPIPEDEVENEQAA